MRTQLSLVINNNRELPHNVNYSKIEEAQASFDADQAALTRDMGTIAAVLAAREDLVTLQGLKASENELMREFAKLAANDHHGGRA